MLARRRFVAYEVAGESMSPALRPGDCVVVDRAAKVRSGDVVLAADPRRRARALVKRVAEVRPEGVVLLGDNRDASTDSRHFGPVPRALLVGRVVCRYWPRPGPLGNSPR